MSCRGRGAAAAAQKKGEQPSAGPAMLHAQPSCSGVEDHAPSTPERIESWSGQASEGSPQHKSWGAARDDEAPFLGCKLMGIPRSRQRRPALFAAVVLFLTIAAILVASGVLLLGQHHPYSLCYCVTPVMHASG